MKRRIRRRMAAAAAGLAMMLMAPGLKAQEAGDFDYYVLALSWNAAWCAVEGDARAAPQCDPAHDIGFVLHGLWPQNDRGWPEYCAVPRRADPSRRQSTEMADLYGSAGLAWHQWKKHGRCSGLSGRDYYALAREAHGRIRRPGILRQLTEPVEVRADVVEAAFLEANPELFDAAVTVTCQDGLVREVRICLARDLSPRACTDSARRSCGSGTLLPMR